MVGFLCYTTRVAVTILASVYNVVYVNHSNSIALCHQFGKFEYSDVMLYAQFFQESHVTSSILIEQLMCVCVYDSTMAGYPKSMRKLEV